jgi:hypothetical protein
MDFPHLILVPRTTVTEPTHHNGRILFLGKTLALRFRAQSRKSKLLERELRQLCGNCRNAMVHIVRSYNGVYINYKQLRSDTNTPNFIFF